MGRGTKIKTGILLTITFILYAIHCTFGGLAGQGVAQKLFPRSVGNASDLLKVLITPIGATFSIWGVIYFWQFAWMLYAFTCLCRNGSGTNLLSGKFYLFFGLSTVFITVWFFTWTRLETVNSLIMLIFHQLFIQVAFGFACSNLQEYLETRSIDNENRADVWCQRILVQNGILFYLTWTLVASLLSMAIVLTRELEAADQTASITALVILAVITILYFYAENFWLKSYTEYTFTFYLGLIWALSGVFVGVWGVNDIVGGLTLGLLVVVCLLFVLRLVVLVLRSRKRESYDQITYNSETQAIKS